MIDPEAEEDPIKARFLSFLESGEAYKNSDLKRFTERKDMDKFKKRIIDQFEWRKEPHMKSLEYNFAAFVECYADPVRKDLLVDVIKKDRPGFKRKYYDRIYAQGEGTNPGPKKQKKQEEAKGVLIAKEAKGVLIAKEPVISADINAAVAALTKTSPTMTKTATKSATVETSSSVTSTAVSGYVPSNNITISTGTISTLATTAMKWNDNSASNTTNNTTNNTTSNSTNNSSSNSNVDNNNGMANDIPAAGITNIAVLTNSNQPTMNAAAVPPPPIPTPVPLPTNPNAAPAPVHTHMPSATTSTTTPIHASASTNAPAEVILPVAPVINPPVAVTAPNTSSSIISSVEVNTIDNILPPNVIAATTTNNSR